MAPPPPPITPSPHRFITSKPTNTASKQPSSLRFQRQPSSSHFAAAPKFNFNAAQKSNAEYGTPTTQYSSPLARRPYLPVAVPTRNREDIEEPSSDREDYERDEDVAFQFTLPTQPTSKRRRPNPPEAITISSGPPSPNSPPGTPLIPTTEHKEPFPIASTNAQTPPTHHPPRFVLPSHAPSTNNPGIPSHPPLLLPPRSPSPPPETPAFFSPHRRGQKYIPGGLACTVRDWIVETAQVGHSHAQARKEGHEAWDVRFRVNECRSCAVGSGVVFVRVRGEASGWMLAGKGRRDGSIEVGCVIGVKEPSWEVEIEGEKWRVGVEWSVLDG